MTPVDAAIVFAAQAHAGQCRKECYVPYIVHPLDVLRQIEKWGIVDRHIFQAAICHDILEDCPKTPKDDLARVISPEAMDYVEELTRVVDPRLDVPSQKQNYLASWLHGKSVESLAIKLADRLCNTRDFAEQRPDYAKKYWNKADAVFLASQQRKGEIIERFGTHSTGRMFQTLQAMENALLLRLA